MDAGVDSCIPVDVREEASKELATHGLLIFNFIRMTLPSVADDGLPKCWGIPNTETTSSINGVVNDLSEHKPRGASSYSEPEKLLDE